MTTSAEEWEGGKYGSTWIELPSIVDDMQADGQVGLDDYTQVGVRVRPLTRHG